MRPPTTIAPLITFALGLAIAAAIGTYNTDRLVRVNIDLRMSLAQCVEERDRSAREEFGVWGERIRIRQVFSQPVAVPVTWGRDKQRDCDEPVLLVAQDQVTEDGLWWVPCGGSR